MYDDLPFYMLCLRLRNFLAFNFWPSGVSIGRCAETSVFVTRVLNETFGEGWRSVAGSYYDGRDKAYHCWSTNDKIIVDLTADQFDTMIAPVLFAAVTDQRYQEDCTNRASYEESQRYYSAWRDMEVPQCANRAKCAL